MTHCQGGVAQSLLLIERRVESPGLLVRFSRAIQVGLLPFNVAQCQRRACFMEWLVGLLVQLDGLLIAIGGLFQHSILTLRVSDQDATIAGPLEITGYSETYFRIAESLDCSIQPAFLGGLNAILKALFRCFNVLYCHDSHNLSFKCVVSLFHM
jgi:hypothetical protein